MYIDDPVSWFLNQYPTWKKHRSGMSYHFGTTIIQIIFANVVIGSIDRNDGTCAKLFDPWS